MKHSITLSTFVLVALFAGCSTPAPVLKLSEKTAQNASILADYADDLAAKHHDLAVVRANATASLNRDFAELQADQAMEVEIMRLAGESNVVNLYFSLRAISDKAAQSFTDVDKLEQTTRTQMLTTQTAIEFPATKLNEVAKQLAELGKDESFQDRVSTFASFVSQVKSEMDKLEKQRDEAAKKVAAAAEKQTANGTTELKH